MKQVFLAVVFLGMCSGIAFAENGSHDRIRDLAGSDGHCGDPRLPLVNITTNHVHLDSQASQMLGGQLNSVTAPVIHTLLASGDPENSVNFVVMGDGFMENQMGLYNQKAQDAVTHLLNLEPFKSFQSHINVYSIEVISNQSGVDFDPSMYSPNKDTALDMGFYCAGNNPQTQKMLCFGSYNYLDYLEFAPGNATNRVVIGIANSYTYGGSGGNSVATSSINGQMSEIVAHEMGHAFAGLADEYLQSNGTNPLCGLDSSNPDHYAVNATRYTATEITQQQRKWYQWLNVNPTQLFGPGFGPTITHVEGSTFQSCHFRPSSQSKMRTLGQPFNMVHIQALIQGIYKRVDLIEASTPEGLHNAMLPLVIETKTDAIKISWFLDGVEIPGAIRKTLLPVEFLNSPAGTLHEISVKVEFDSPLVRLNPNQLQDTPIESFRTWPVAVR